MAMTWSLLAAVNLLGTIAFAISGTFVGIQNKMDLFGINMLAITTACGGGLLRDLVIGITPPMLCRNPIYVAISAVVANVIFIFLYLHKEMPARLEKINSLALFWFDTLGLAAFSVNGVMIGVRVGYRAERNMLLLVFLGFLTGVGGGLLRDVLARRIPDIFTKHIYAIASIIGALVTVLILVFLQKQTLAMTAGFFVVVLLRLLASHFRWNLPKISD